MCVGIGRYHRIRAHSVFRVHTSQIVVLEITSLRISKSRFTDRIDLGLPKYRLSHSVFSFVKFTAVSVCHLNCKYYHILLGHTSHSQRLWNKITLWSIDYTTLWIHVEFRKGLNFLAGIYFPFFHCSSLRFISLFSVATVDSFLFLSLTLLLTIAIFVMMAGTERFLRKHIDR